MPPINQPKINLFTNLHRLQINDADVAVLTAGSHNYDNTNQSTIQLAVKSIKDSQSDYYFRTLFDIPKTTLRCISKQKLMKIYHMWLFSLTDNDIPD